MTTSGANRNCARCKRPLPAERLYQCAACDVAVERARAEWAERERSSNFERLMSESGLPREYRRGERGFRDVPAALEPIVGDCSRLGGELPGLFLFGPSKGFKTTIAASALADWIRIPSVDQHGKLTHRGGRYVDATDLMTELQATYGVDSTESREDIVTRYAEAPALVVDDLGQEAATAHAGSVLRQILDRRRREYRPGTWLIVTSNRTPEQLRDRFGEPETGNAILHRLAQLCVTIPVAGGKA